MGPFEATLIIATLLCSLVAGLVFTFAIVVMPGIKTLSDGEFIRAFQVMDRIIQDNQPLFMIAWIGSALSLLVCGVWGIWELGGAQRVLLIVAAALYFLTVQMPTIAINIPLNNRLQSLDVGSMAAEQLRSAREDFEPRWVRWNAIRTVFAIVVSTMLLVLLLLQ